MSKFIRVTVVTFLANKEQKNREEQKIYVNVNIIKEFSTERDSYTYNDKICTVIRVNSGDWGYIVTETEEELLEMINK
jgi:hypothetical protein